MSSIADDPADELRALRERAYGRGADIQDDPAAMQRLRELEDGERDTETTAPSPGRDAAREGEADEPAPVAHALAPSPVVEEPAGARLRWRRRMPLVWAGALVTAGVLGAAIAFSVHAISAGQVAILGPDPGAEWPPGYFDRAPNGATAFREFHGLVPVHLPQQMHPDAAPSNCLYLAAPEADSFGFFSVGCGAGPFPAAVVVLVTPDAPDELIEHYAPGTALRFVLDGSQVRVYAADPVPGVTP